MSGITSHNGVCKLDGLHRLPHYNKRIGGLLCATATVALLVSCGVEPGPHSSSISQRSSPVVQHSSKHNLEAVTTATLPEIESSPGYSNGVREPSTETGRATADDEEATVESDESDAGGIVVGQDSDTEPAVDPTPVIIYQDARAALRSGEIDEAIELFRDVEDNYPYLDLSRQAKLGVAYALFLEGEYQNAIQELNQFMEYYPVHQNIDYAYYLEAVSYYKQIAGHGRDAASARLAFNALEVFLRHFPDSQ